MTRLLIVIGCGAFIVGFALGFLAALALDDPERRA